MARQYQFPTKPRRLIMRLISCPDCRTSTTATTKLFKSANGKRIVWDCPQCQKRVSRPMSSNGVVTPDRKLPPMLKPSVPDLAIEEATPAEFTPVESWLWRRIKQSSHWLKGNWPRLIQPTLLILLWLSFWALREESILRDELQEE